LRSLLSVSPLTVVELSYELASDVERVFLCVEKLEKEGFVSIVRGDSVSDVGGVFVNLADSR
jgi:hypothetical protein